MSTFSRYFRKNKKFFVLRERPTLGKETTEDIHRRHDYDYGHYDSSIHSYNLGLTSGLGLGMFF